MPKSKDLLPCEAIPAEERAETIGREIRKSIRNGEFEFVHGYLNRIRKPGAETCTYGGCAIAALAFVVGSRPNGGVGYLLGEECRQDAVDTGLVTFEEARELEDGYEGNESRGGPFAALGRDLSAYAKKRGGRWSREIYKKATEPFSIITRYE
jgi:hypothetical protein